MRVPLLNRVRNVAVGRRSRTTHYQREIARCLRFAVLLGSLAGCEGATSARTPNPVTHGVLSTRPAGTYRSRILESIGRPALKEIVAKLDVRWPADVSDLQHAWRLRHAAGEPLDPAPFCRPEDGTVLDSNTIRWILLDDGRFQESYPYGVSFLRPTMNGIAVYEAPVSGGRKLGEYHRDQLLCVLAECEMPRDWVVACQQHKGTVDDLLGNSLADLMLEQELPWSIIAVAAYGVPLAKWSNKFGLQISLDDLVESLLEHQPGNGACHGIHECYALATVLNLQRRTPVLSEPVALWVEERLAEIGATLERSQYPDGAWREDWHTASQPIIDIAADPGWGSSLTATGHHLEWLALVPELPLSPACIERALQFAVSLVQNASPEMIRKQYGPYSHAVRGILLWHPQGRHILRRIVESEQPSAGRPQHQSRTRRSK